MTDEKNADAPPPGTDPRYSMDHHSMDSESIDSRPDTESEGCSLPGEEPGEEYRRRLLAREAAVARLSGTDARLGWLRLMLALALVAMAWGWFRTHAFPWWLLLLPVLCFVPVAAQHARVLRRRVLARRAVAVYQAGLARIEDRWAASGQQEPRGAFESSLFATDLDLFGKNSLFALLSTARTRVGEDTLAGWLLAPAPIEQVLRRQEAVAELRGQLDLREDAALLGADAGSAVHTRELVGWAEEPVVLAREWVRYAALGFALLVVAALVFWAVEGTRAPLFGLVAIAVVVHYAHRRKAAAVLGGADRALADLELLAALLQRLERASFTVPALQELQARLLTGGSAAEKAYGSASRAIGKLRRIGAYIDARDNIFVRVLNVPLLYSVQLAYLAEDWRKEHGSAVRHWLGAVGELEALLSLAGYSYEHPADRFPEFATEADTDKTAACFAAEALGHPLLPAARCVRNDVRLGGDQPVLLISGSNMSGKSTLLRAVGLNAVLAMAGGPVRARRLRMTPVAVGASILVNDSLAEGSSRFYSEIKRLRAICDLAAGADLAVGADLAWGVPPLLFLLDELLEGTNSRDRRVGAEGILRTLAARGAIGMVSTHDLALTETHGDLRFANRHFQDAVRDGKMHFDYTLREGVVTKSNGVELMRLVGLDV